MKTRLVLLAMIALLCAPAHAQTPSAESLSREVADLKRQVAALEQRLDLVISMLNRQTGEGSVPTTTAAPARASVAPSAPRPPASATRIQCQATTKKGTQCSRMAAAGASYCWQHGR